MCTAQGGPSDYRPLDPTKKNIAYSRPNIAAHLNCLPLDTQVVCKNEENVNSKSEKLKFKYSFDPRPKEYKTIFYCLYVKLKKTFCPK